MFLGLDDKVYVTALLSVQVMKNFGWIQVIGYE